jgi:hypothetical protein
LLKEPANIFCTPKKNDHGDLSGQFAALSKTKLKVEPFLFDDSELEVSVRGRIVPRRPYRSQEEFRDVYRRQEREKFEYTLVPK